MLTFTISLRNLRFYSYHGLLPQERMVGNDFEVSVSVQVPAPDVPSDSLDGSVSYADIFEIVKKRMEIPADTLEFLAMDMRRMVMAECPAVIACRVEIVKCAPPIPGIQGSASVAIG